MKLLILLVVLGLRRVELAWPAWLTNPARFALMLLPLGDLAEKLRLTGVFRWAVMVALPAVVIGWLIAWLHCLLWGLAGWVAGGLLLLWLLGPSSESRQVDDLLVRGRMNDVDGVAETAALFDVDAAPGDAGFHAWLRRNILHREAGHLFATIFWLITLGYWAALLYVLNYFLVRAGDRDEGCREAAVVLHTALLWIPGRLLVLCMGLAGNWQRVSEAIGGRFWQLDETLPLLEDVMAAALEQDDTPPTDLQAGMDRLEDQQGLLLRCLALWLLLAALWVLLT